MLISLLSRCVRSSEDKSAEASVPHYRRFTISEPVTTQTGVYAGNIS